MSLDPQVIRSEPHIEIGHLIQQNVDQILDRWSEEAIKQQPNATRVHHSVMLDHLRELLTSIGRGLAATKDPHTNGHCLPASRHGENRWEAGWSLPEVVRDYQILRLVILDFLEETLHRPMDGREILAIGLALDEAIAASVVMYVKGRNQFLSQLEDKRTEQDRQYQKQLQQQADALKEADRRKNEFLAMLSHELRSPLAPMRTALQILKLKGPQDPELIWTRDVIARQVEQMTRMVDDLLDISRITRGLIQLQKEPVELAVVVERAVEMARPLIDARKHQLTVVLSPPAPVWLNADSVRLVQAITNLLHNSAKYTDEGGQIELTARREGDDVVIKVRDNGVGISSELLPRVFEPFTQDERALDRSQGGLGIGLALVKSLTELHGGKVQAFSAGQGQGSEFLLQLPAMKEAPPPASQLEQESHVSASSRKILVVDDSLDGARSLSMLLEILGHEVRTVHDGPMALAEAEKFLPEVVLMDIGLPGMDGFEVARRMRQDHGMKDTTLVAITGYGQDEDRRRSHEAGFDAHLVKPIDPKDLNHLLASFGTKAKIQQASPA
ncbi:MAG TPA: ATP-binding protein [Gemmataceae bacterium]|jgi:signal transduction histidine kinase/ActR/RegA family two-component response regulator|nr:ATP-binding protein [Gemmataceae bacterium]